MPIKKVLCKKIENNFYNNYKINNDILNIIFSYLGNLYLNKREKEIYLILSTNDKLKQKINYFAFINNEYLNYKSLNIYFIFISYLFERNTCDFKITNKYTVRWDNNLLSYVTNIETNIYEINLKVVFLINELTTDSLKALKSVLYRLRYIDKKNKSVYYQSYSLKKNNYRQLFNLNINFIITLDNDNSIKLNTILQQNTNNNRIYDIKNNNPSGENNKTVKDNIKFINEHIINKIITLLDTNLIKLKK
jgi:hypothetical protein